ncbi:FtsB family cell division protein [Brevundimonas variabilis]|nr:septum formation initiator family protein [Brevundimonas variabilis]
MKPYLPTIGLFLLIVYLGVQALTGQRGLLSGNQRDAMLELREHELAVLAEQRHDLELRVRYLRSGHLSRDMLEERARVVLGFSDPRDYVIRTTTATVPQASVAAS